MTINRKEIVYIYCGILCACCYSQLLRFLLESPFPVLGTFFNLSFPTCVSVVWKLVGTHLQFDTRVGGSEKETKTERLCSRPPSDRLCSETQDS